MDADTMTSQPADTSVSDPVPHSEQVTADELTAESLIEEVSIDGMCGVY